MGELSGDNANIRLMSTYWNTHASHDGASHATSKGPCISIKIISLERNMENDWRCFAAVLNRADNDIITIGNC